MPHLSGPAIIRDRPEGRLGLGLVW